MNSLQYFVIHTWVICSVWQHVFSFTVAVLYETIAPRIQNSQMLSVICASNIKKLQNHSYFFMFTSPHHNHLCKRVSFFLLILLLPEFKVKFILFSFYFHVFWYLTFFFSPFVWIWWRWSFGFCSSSMVYSFFRLNQLLHTHTPTHRVINTEQIIRLEWNTKKKEVPNFVLLYCRIPRFFSLFWKYLHKRKRPNW